MTRITVNPNTGDYEQALDFDVQADPDRVFNSSSTSLAPTVFNSSLQANPSATVGESSVMPLMLLEERGQNAFASQGSDTLRGTLFGNWQYVDRIVSWGGTSARNVTAPGQAWIDAAHRNGVKIYGNVFLAPRDFGGRVSHVEYLTQTDGSGNYLVADKLIEIAETQGFDGWFLNQETSLTASSEMQAGAPADDPAGLAEEVGKFMDYWQANSSVEILWYDAMTESGSVGWQDELNSNNDRFFQNAGQVVSEAMFLDFGANTMDLNDSRNLANSLGRSEFDVYAGVKMDAAGISEGDVALDLYAGSQATSIGMFRPDIETWNAYNSSGFDPQAHIRAEEQLYVGELGDPSDTSQNVVTVDGATSWNGYAEYIAAKSPLTRDRFVSNFNYGVGTDYYVDGEVVNSSDWYNMGAQDVLPTWRWMVQTTDATPLDVNFDFDDAFLGGSSIKIEGSLDEQTDIPLYLSSMGVFGDSKLSLTYKTGAVGASELQVYVEIEGAEGIRIPFNVGSTSDTGWNEVELDLSSLAGQTIASIGLRLLDADDASYEVSIGQIGLIRGARDVIAPATNLEVPVVNAIDSDTRELRITWDHSADYSSDYASNNLYYYNVYQELADSSRVLLGVTGGEGLYIEALEREAMEFSSTLIIEAVSLEFGLSTTTLLFSWGDVDGDGLMTQADIDDFIFNWKADTSALGYNDRVAMGDVNADGITDFDDWFIIRAAFNEAGAAFSNPFLAAPEPSSALLLGVMAGAGLLRRARRTEARVG